jgi:hypothetical protein
VDDTSEMKRIASSSSTDRTATVSAPSSPCLMSDTTIGLDRPSTSNTPRATRRVNVPKLPRRTVVLTSGNSGDLSHTLSDCQATAADGGENWDTVTCSMPPAVAVRWACAR